MKDRRFHNYLFTVYVIFAIIASVVLISCEQPTAETIKTIIVYRELTQEEKDMELKPITEYEKYCVTEDLKVYGLKGRLKEMIALEDNENQLHPFNDFFVIKGKIYFTVKYMISGDPIKDTDPVQYEAVEKIGYFSQNSGEIKAITQSTFPKKPESSFIEMGISPFSIVTFNYNGMDTSRVLRDGKPTGFKMIDGYFNTNDGLWFSVPETISTRLKGVYFYPKDKNLASSPVMSGRIW